MTTILTPLSVAARTYRALDSRLAALLELSDTVFEPADPEPLPRAVPSGHESAGDDFSEPVTRRDGPLAFFTGALPRSSTPGAGDSFELSEMSSVSVFVTARSNDALTSAGLRAGGVVWRSRAGAIGTTDVRLRQLRKLDKNPDVLAVEWTGGAVPLGVFKPGDGILPREAVGLRTASGELDGTGVVVGIVDSDGLHVHHPDFIDNTGKTRILALWDQTKTEGPKDAGIAPAPYGYGSAYDQSDLQKEVDSQDDRRYSTVAHRPKTDSHGTMVAGLAAGGGRAAPEMAGVAPGAEIVFVSTRASKAGALAAMTEIAEAADFVFRQAGDRPAVINVSLGDNLGPRNGTSPVERFFDELLAERPGRAIVVAAGNANESEAATACLLSDKKKTATLVCKRPRESSRNAVIEIWYDGAGDGEDGISVQVESIEGKMATPVILADGLARAFDLDCTRLIVTSLKRYPASEDALIRLEMFPKYHDKRMETGDILIRLGADSVSRTVYAWLDHPGYSLYGSSSNEAPPITLLSPATSKSVITVGACEHKSGRISSFSGRGPSRGGSPKPNVLACGVDLCAPSTDPDAPYRAEFTGTSAATPLVTGTVALLFEHALERGERLTPEQTSAHLRAAFSERSHHDSAASERAFAAAPPRHRRGRASDRLEEEESLPPQVLLPSDTTLGAIFARLEPPSE